MLKQTYQSKSIWPLFISALLLSFAFFVPESHSQWVRAKGATRQTVLSFVTKGSTIFAGARHGPFPDTTYIGGALRSTDNGATWVTIDSGFVSQTVFSVSVYSLLANGDSLLAGTSNGVYVSTNDGTNWKDASTGIDSDDASRNVQALLLSGSNLFAGTQNGIFYSSDRGANWVRRDSGLGLNNPSKNVLCMTSIGQVVFASVNTDDIYASSDTGKSWTKPFKSFRSVMSFAVMESTFFGAYEPIWISPDSGKSWSGLITSPRDTVTNDLCAVVALNTYKQYLFAGTLFYGIYLSPDLGKSWNAINGGFEGNSFFDVWSITIAGDYLLIGGVSSQYTGIWRRPLSEVITSIPRRQIPIPRTVSLGQNYPNPFNPKTTIEYNLSYPSFVTLEVFDLLGRKVKTLVNGVQTSQRNTISFDASQMATGIYLYRLTANGCSMVRKMVLTK